MFSKLWEKYPGTLIGLIIGILVGIIFLLAGFWKTVIFTVFVTLGLFIGKKFDRHDDLKGILEEILPDKFFK